jgi:hypothetical protein
VICRHGLAADDCRECLPCGLTVDEFVAQHGDGADLPTIAAALGVSKQYAQLVERHALGKLTRPLRRTWGPEVDGGEHLTEGQRIWRRLRRLEDVGHDDDAIAQLMGLPGAVLRHIRRRHQRRAA